MTTLTQERLREVLNYNFITGIFTWIKLEVNNQVKLNDIAGSPDAKGYLKITIDTVSYRVQRLAFLYMKGYFPEYDVDHKNGIVIDNRWCNLRHTSRTCNLQNTSLSSTNKSGFKGVCIIKKTSKWQAYITIQYKRITIGHFDTPEEAAIARVQYEDSCSNWHCNEQDVNRVKLRKLGYIL